MKKVTLPFILMLFAVAGILFWKYQGSQLVSSSSDSQLVFPKAPAKEKISLVDSSIIHDEQKWTTNNTHDAEIIQVGNEFYAFSTDYKVGGTPTPGIQIRKSNDLIHWTFVGRVFNDTSAEAKEWTNGVGTTFWAPDVVELNGAYYLYYSVSEFGTRNSLIGLAVSDSITGPWVDQGPILRSHVDDGKTVNAIDPAIITDANGQLWMSYGSYAGGIFLLQLDASTGKPLNSDAEGTLIAKRGSENHQALEGSTLMYNKDTKYYYFTGSYGWLEDTYNVRVGRSRNIEGPYVDYNSLPLIDVSSSTGNPETGTKIIGSYAFDGDSGWTGTGHNGLLTVGDNDYIVHNARTMEDKFWSHLHVRKLVWTDDGWPVASPERYAGEKQQTISENDFIGDWEHLLLSPIDDGVITSEKITLLENGKIGEGNSKDTWEYKNNTLILKWYDPANAPNDYWEDKVKVLPGWDWENWRSTIVFTGLDQKGTAIWGKKIMNETK